MTVIGPIGVATDNIGNRVQTFICMLCEMVQFAIDELANNPILQEITIHFKNERGTAKLQLGDKYIDGDTFGYGQIVNNKGTYLLSRTDIFSLYYAARGQASPIETVVFIVALVCQQGDEPTFSTSIRVKSEYKKYIHKPQFDKEGILIVHPKIRKVN